MNTPQIFASQSQLRTMTTTIIKRWPFLIVLIAGKLLLLFLLLSNHFVSCPLTPNPWNDRGNAQPENDSTFSGAAFSGYQTVHEAQNFTCFVSFDCFACPLFCCTWPACYVFVSPVFFGCLEHVPNFCGCEPGIQTDETTTRILICRVLQTILSWVLSRMLHVNLQYSLSSFQYNMIFPEDTAEWRSCQSWVLTDWIPPSVRSKSRVVCVCGCFPVALYLYIFGKDPFSIVAFHYCV